MCTQLPLLKTIRAAMAALAIGLLSQTAMANGIVSSAVHEADQRTVCRASTLRIEAQHSIPQGLLYALALTESGRWDKQSASSYAWPWTIRSGPDAFVGDNLEMAVEIVEQLQADGRRNIDIGCMQVNLMYHPDAFADLWEGFDPETNADYAASFLKELRQKHHSWARAIERYHSSDRQRARDYRERVYRHWNSVRKSLASERSADRKQPQLVRPVQSTGERSRVHFLYPQRAATRPVLLK